MGLIIQQRALRAAGGLRQVMAVVRKRDKSLFDQIHRAMNSVVLNIAEADGNDAGTALSRSLRRCRVPPRYSAPHSVQLASVDRPATYRSRESYGEPGPVLARPFVPCRKHSSFP